jgi:hypothetical protein
MAMRAQILQRMIRDATNEREAPVFFQDGRPFLFISPETDWYAFHLSAQILEVGDRAAKSLFTNEERTMIRLLGYRAP